LRPLGVGFELLTEIAHVDAQILRFLGVFLAPDFGKELAVGDDLTRVFG